MAQDTPKTAGAEVTLADGIVAIPTEYLVTLPAKNANARGIILADHRTQVYAPHDGKPILYTLSVYIQREPLDDEEIAKVTKIAAERKAAKDARTKAEQDARERDLKRAQELGQDAVMSALRNIGALTQAAAVLNKL